MWLNRALIVRAAIFLFVLAAILVGAIGTPEWLRYRERVRDSRAAQAARPTAAQFQAAMSDQSLNAPNPGVQSSWAAFAEAQAEYETLAAAVNVQDFKPGEQWNPDFCAAFRPSPENQLPYDQQVFQREGAAFLKRADDDRLCKAMDRLADSAPTIRPDADWPIGKTEESLVRQLGEMKRLARFNEARIDRAVRRNDLSEFRSALRSSLVMARTLEVAPFLASRHVALYIHQLVSDQLITLIVEGLPPPFVEEAQRMLREQPISVDLDFTLHSQQLRDFEVICRVFAESDIARRQSVINSLFDPRIFKVPRAGSIGTFNENVAGLNKAVEEQIEAAHLPLKFRTAGGAGSTGTPLTDALWKPLPTVRDSLIQAATHRESLLVMLALEQYRAKAGGFPADLAALVPKYLAAIPLDPWSEGPLRYRCTDASKDPYHRSYLLYSIGADGHDDGGAVGPSGNSVWSFRSPGVRGTDYIVNAPMLPPLKSPNDRPVE